MPHFGFFFMWSQYSWSLMEITPVHTTFCGYYPCVHYFLWLRLCALHFVEITPVSTMFCGDYPCVHYFLWMLPLCALLFVDVTPVCTMFCDYPCVHYFLWILPLCTTFMFPWLTMTSIWVMMLPTFTSNTHNMGNDVTSNTHIHCFW